MCIRDRCWKESKTFAEDKNKIRQFLFFMYSDKNVWVSTCALKSPRNEEIMSLGFTSFNIASGPSSSISKGKKC